MAEQKSSFEEKYQLTAAAKQKKVGCDWSMANSLSFWRSLTLNKMVLISRKKESREMSYEAGGAGGKKVAMVWGSSGGDWREKDLVEIREQYYESHPGCLVCFGCDDQDDSKAYVYMLEEHLQDNFV